MKDTYQSTEAIEWLGVSYKTILSTAETGGAMSIVDTTAPLGSGPPRHIHQCEDEIFIILSGQCEFWLEGQRFLRGPGETAFVPRGSSHTFRVVGTGPSRHLVILTPGGFEGFFADMARGQFRIPEDMAEIAVSAEAHHLIFTGPRLGDA